MLGEKLQDGASYQQLRAALADDKNWKFDAHGGGYGTPGATGAAGAPQQELFDTLVRWLPKYESRGGSRGLPDDPQKLLDAVDVELFNAPQGVRNALSHEVTHPPTMNLSDSYQNQLKTMATQAFDAVEGLPRGLRTYLTVPTETIANSTQLFSLVGHPMRMAVQQAEAETGMKWSEMSKDTQDIYFNRALDKFREGNTGAKGGDINETLQTLYNMLSAPSGGTLLEHLGRTWSANGRRPKQGNQTRQPGGAGDVSYA